MEVRVRYLKDGSLVYQLRAETQVEKSLHESIEYMKPRLFVVGMDLHLEFVATQQGG